MRNQAGFIVRIILIVALGFSAAGCNDGPMAPKNWGTLTGEVRLTYDRTWRPTDRFRMAMMIVTEDGRKITDFFQGIELTGDGVVGSGNVILPVPRVWGTLCGNAVAGDFCKDFAAFVGTPFSLTFKEFTSFRYRIRDVPKGTAYIWFQRSFDGNRVTQVPHAVKIDTKMLSETRLDLVLDNSMDYFYFL